jgi:putative nucleotidyltransferase with HDIG domain
MLEKVKEAVREEAINETWVHIQLVAKYARYLAKKEGVNEEVAELAALMHDIGRVKLGGKDHEITGVEEADKILKKIGYPEDVVEEVKHCVRSHRASKDYPAKTKIALIVRDADAMAHFDMIPSLFRVGLSKHDGNVEKTIEWIEAKLDRDWNRKMHLAESKKITEEKYKAAKLLLKLAKDTLEEFGKNQN